MAATRNAERRRGCYWHARYSTHAPSSADYAREERWAPRSCRRSSLATRSISPRRRGRSVLAILTEAGREAHGGVVIVHGLGVHPDWGLISGLRTTRRGRLRDAVGADAGPRGRAHRATTMPLRCRRPASASRRRSPFCSDEWHRENRDRLAQPGRDDGERVCSRARPRDRSPHGCRSACRAIFAARAEGAGARCHRGERPAGSRCGAASAARTSCRSDACSRQTHDRGDRSLLRESAARS